MLKSARKREIRYISLPLKSEIDSFWEFDRPAQHPAEAQIRRIGIGTDLEPEDVLKLALRHDLDQIVQTSSIAMATELLTSEIMISNPDLFMNYPLSCILCPERAGPEPEIQSRAFSAALSASVDAGEILGAFANYISGVLQSTWLQTDAFLIADELVSNALNYGCLGNITGSISAGSDDERLVICVKDNAGQLNLSRYIRTIGHCYQNSFGTGIQIREDSQSAGIGAYFVYNSSISYYVGVERDVATVVCCALPLRRTRSRQSVVLKNLHIVHD